MRKTIKGLEEKIATLELGNEILEAEGAWFDEMLEEEVARRDFMNRVWFTICFVEWCLLVAVFFFH